MCFIFHESAFRVDAENLVITHHDDLIKGLLVKVGFWFSIEFIKLYVWNILNLTCFCMIKIVSKFI